MSTKDKNKGLIQRGDGACKLIIYVLAWITVYEWIPAGMWIKGTFKTGVHKMVINVFMIEEMILFKKYLIISC